MPYDFESLVDRSRAGSIKYQLMLKEDPEAPAGIVPLSIGDMELRNPPELASGLADYLEHNVLGYTSPTPADLQATTDWMRSRHDWTVDRDWIVGIDGIVPALYAAVETFTEKGDGVIYMPPVYRPFRHAVTDIGRRAVPAPLLESAGGYVMDFEALEKAAADPSVRMLLLCSPHNPVARIWRREELERLGDICLKHGVLVVSDEIHMDFAMPGHRHLVFSEIKPEFRNNCVVCTSPSKTFNIAGLQVSNIVIPDARLRKRFAGALAKSGRHGPNQLGLAACRIVYERCGGWLDQALRLIHENGETVRRFMAEHYPEVRVHDHEGTYFIWLDFRKWDRSPEELRRFMTRAARLFLDEGYIFGEEGCGFERINLACPKWVIRDALDRLLRAGRA